MLLLSNQMVNKLAVCIFFANQSFLLHASKFDNSFLYGRKSDVDLGHLITTDSVPEGDYYLDVYLNNKFILHSKVNILDNKNKLEPKLQNYCIPRKTVKVLDFKKELIDLNKNTSECIDTREMNHVVFWTIDIEQQRLDISSPQDMLNERPVDYIDPALWENGVNSSFIKYNYNYYKSEIDNQISVAHDFLNLDAGINLGSWQLRHTGNTSFTEDQSEYITNETKLLTSIPKLKAQFTLGDFYTTSQALESNSSLSLRGAQIATDEQMLPSSIRTYAPTISGFANTNALVRVKQDNQILFERSVPAGAFNFTNMYTPISNGQITVDIIELNGEIRSFNLPYNSFIRALRPKQYRYQLALGQYRKNDKSYDENVFNVALEYGLNNYLTILGSSLVSDHYKSYTVGTTINTFFGGMALEANRVSSEMPSFKDTLDSSRFSFRYNVSLFNKTNVGLGYTFYKDENYYTFDDVMVRNYLLDENSNLGYKNSFYANQNKTYSYAHLSHFISNRLGTLNSSYSENTFWDQKKQQSYQLNYSNQFKNKISYSFGVQHTNSESIYDTVKDTQYFLSLNMPLDLFRTKSSLAYSGTFRENTDRELNHRVGISGNFGDFNQYGYGVNYSENEHQNNLSTSFNYRATPIAVSTTYSTNFDNQQQYSAQVQGAIVAHKYGVTLNNELGDTFAIVHAKGLKGVHLRNGQNVKFDHFGNAIVSYFMPYQYNIVQLDSDTLPIATEVDAVSIQAVPKKNTSMLIKFNATSLNKALVELEHANMNVPMGVTCCR